MKNLFTLLLLTSIFVHFSSAQSLDIDLVANTHNGGYHVSCFGGNDATISSVVTGGTAPYTYSWSNGSTTGDIVDVPADTYTLTVTDSLGLSNTATIILTQPTTLSVSISSFTGLAGCGMPWGFQYGARPDLSYWHEQQKFCTF